MIDAEIALGIIFKKFSAAYLFEEQCKEVDIAPYLVWLKLYRARKFAECLLAVVGKVRREIKTRVKYHASANYHKMSG